jgi:hypothetical protein
VPFAKTDDRVRIYSGVHGRGAPLALAYGIGGNTDMWDVNRDQPEVWNRTVLEFLAWCERRGRG